MECNYCKGICIKKGYYKGVQKYKCKGCFKVQQEAYKNRKYTSLVDDQITLLNNEGIGISSISRILSIPKASVQRRIERMQKDKPKPVFTEKGQAYEVDELYTYIGSKDKPCYMMYAINRKTKEVIDFICGARTKENINKIIQRLLNLAPKRIYTDGLKIYGSLTPSNIHRTFQYACIGRSATASCKSNSSIAGARRW